MASSDLFYVGIDVSKDNLDCDIHGVYWQVANNTKGFAALVKKIHQLLDDNQTLTAIVCEASGGYEKPMARYMHTHQLPIIVAHANRVKAFSKSCGILAKTDAIDARNIRHYAATLALKPGKTYLKASGEALQKLLKRREQLEKDILREKVRLQQTTDTFMKQSIQRHIRFLKKELEKLEEAIRNIQTKKDIQEDYELLTSIPAIGPIAARYAIAFLPEFRAFRS